MVAREGLLEKAWGRLVRSFVGGILIDRFFSLLIPPSLQYVS